MKKILFVDDEPKVLGGLRRMLHSLRHEWDMAFVGSGQEALARLTIAVFDVVVTDMRMPGMDGAELLAAVKVRHPATVRIILSGQCDREAVLKAVRPAHQFLTKPCDPQTLKATVARACRLRDQLADQRHEQLVSRVESVASRPSVFAELVAELQSPRASLPRVGEIISRDIGTTAKVLQLTNSGFFGAPQHVCSAQQAADLLGLDVLRTLAFSAKAFSPRPADAAQNHLLEMLTEHSLAVAAAAGKIAQAEGGDQQMIGNAFLAGFLHDIGILVLAQETPQRSPQMIGARQQGRLSFVEIEQQYCGTTHAEIGAYLAALWGFPDAVVEAIALHHRPHAAVEKGFRELTAVHVANACHAEGLVGGGGVPAPIDLDYLMEIGCAGRLDAWREICRAFTPQGVLS